MTVSKVKSNVPATSGPETQTTSSLEEQAAIRQWLEYKKVYLDRLGSEIPSNILSELDHQLGDRSYLVGSHLTAADSQIYVALYDYYAKQSFQVKEKYIHLARWFNHVQHVKRQRPLLTFSRTLLYN